MNCPYCQQSFPLTWRRYLTSPLGRHTCPHCGRRSQVKRGAAQLLFTAVLLWVIAIPLIGLLHHWVGRYWSLLGVVPAGLVVVPFDKLLDEKIRGLEPLKK